MKKLIFYDHNGNKLLELEVFVDGQDFSWQSPRPQAFWFGKVLLVDQEPEPEEKVEVATTTVALEVVPEVKEEKVEPTEVDNQNTGDSRVSETSEPESIEGIYKEPAGREPTKRSKKSRKRKAA